jgi:Zn-finger nucleic acid-binding protein
MKCPVCETTEMLSTYLEKTLPAHTCPTCGGIWVASTHYWTWLEEHSALLPKEPDNAVSPSPTTDMKRAGICPWCGHLLLKYKVAHDIPFTLDQCGHCNSFWFDKHEWEALKSRNLHNAVHKVFTDPWQRRLREEESQHHWQAFYLQKFGTADYAEIQRIRAWLQQHPERDRLIAYLINENPYKC